MPIEAINVDEGRLESEEMDDRGTGQEATPMERVIFPGSCIRRKIISQRQPDCEVEPDATRDNDPCNIRHGKILTQDLETCQYCPKVQSQDNLADPLWMGIAECCAGAGSAPNGRALPVGQHHQHQAPHHGRKDGDGHERGAAAEAFGHRTGRAARPSIAVGQSDENDRQCGKARCHNDRGNTEGTHDRNSKDYREVLQRNRGMEPEPNSVANATVPGLELTKKMACNEAAKGVDFRPAGGLQMKGPIRHPKRVGMLSFLLRAPKKGAN